MTSSATSSMIAATAEAASRFPFSMKVRTRTEATSVLPGRLPESSTSEPYSLIPARRTVPRRRRSRDEIKEEIVDPALALAAERGNEPVGRITADITTAFLPDGPDSDTLPDRDDRASESTLGGLVANVLRDTLAEEDLGSAEIGVVNPGGLRAELLYAGNTQGPPANPANTDGVVTFAEANSVLPFTNELWTISLTGAQFVTMLEQQWQRNADGTVPTRAYLQLGLSDNVTYTYHEVPDGANTRGVIDSVSIDGEPLDPDRSYRIGTFSFLATGGDNFRVFRDGAEPQGSGLIDFEAFISYLQENQPLSPDFARQAVQVSNQPTEVDEGAMVRFGLSKLDLTSLGSPANTEVQVRMERESGLPVQVGRFEVSQGAATVSFAAPAPGEYTLVAVASPSTTTVRFPLTVNDVVEPPAAEVSARSIADQDRERVFVRVRATNTDTVPLDIRFVTAWGDVAEFDRVLPGATVRHRFATGRGSVEAGVVRVETVKTVDEETYEKTYEAPYAAATATVDPRGYVDTEAFRVRGEVFYRAYFTNLGADPVTVRLRTDFGRSAWVTVSPDRTGTVTVATGRARTPRTFGALVARKTVDGESYRSVFDVRFPAVR